MTIKKEFDYIIIGQGLAGSILGYTLLKKNKSVLIIDSNEENASSKVAAGIFNPITGRKMVKTWLADQLFPFLHQFYKEMEKELETSFFHPTNMYFPFATQEKQNDWLLVQSNKYYKDYIVKFHEKGLYNQFVKAEFGGMEVTQAGYLDIPKMLKALRIYLNKKSNLINEKVLASDFIFESETIKWKDYKGKKLILCDGIWGLSSAFFPFLDFRPVKGEVLTVDFEQNHFRHVVNRNGWILPINNATQYKFGATYNNREVNSAPSAEGKNQLVERLENLVNLPYTIQEHKAGIRPATYDRRPFIGLHPENNMLGIFNGLGAKGVSLAPFLARHFVEFLHNEAPLMQEIDIVRSYHRFNKKQSHS